jgi:phosphoribosylformylglycinamidine cyclo-ligase
MSRPLDITAGGATYAGAGVDIAAGDATVERMKEAVASTMRPGVRGGIGGFAGLFDIAALTMTRPVLVASADGVGTKLDVARLAGRYDTVGYDLVAMLVDDLVCLGAQPLFLLDYVAVGRLDPTVVTALVTGLAAACREAGVALLGGETAEHGGVMGDDNLDLAGFVVGAVEDGATWGPERCRVGDTLIGLASPGLRSNGYSLARRVLLDGGRDLHEPAFPGATTSLVDELLRPSVIYAPGVLAAARVVGGVHAAAHITGGGLVGNVPRMLPADLDAVVALDAFDTPELFFEIQRRGNVAAAEMLRVFNMGLGMVLAVDADAAESLLDELRRAGLGAMRVGELRPGEGKVQLL